MKSIFANVFKGIFESDFEYILAALFTALLGYALIRDLRVRRVKRWVWLGCGAAALALFLLKNIGRGTLKLSILLELLIFTLTQFLWFSKMYGKADCFAFACCSVFLGAYGGRLREYLIHMLFSVIILGLVQLFRGNVNSKGNLKEPAAFIPYIAAALPVTLLWMVFA